MQLLLNIERYAKVLASNSEKTNLSLGLIIFVLPIMIGIIYLAIKDKIK